MSLRRHLTFTCQGATLAATLDWPSVEPPTHGLLIVTGGNEVRAGAFDGQARIAARLAASGYAVFRFDRRGVGDSEGPNAGFRASGPDIAAALASFRAELPSLARITAWGNCDAASALMLAGGADVHALVLSNPWTIEDDTPEQAALPVHALRAHYRQRLTSPAAIWRLLTGKVSWRGLAASLRSLGRRADPPAPLALDMAARLATYNGPVRILLSGLDRTAHAFAGQWPRDDPRVTRCPQATHAFVEPEAQEWLVHRLLEMVDP